MRHVESVTGYGFEPAANDFPRAGERREWGESVLFTRAAQFSEKVLF